MVGGGCGPPHRYSLVRWHDLGAIRMTTTNTPPVDIDGPKPCPFCGSRIIATFSPMSPIVACTDCDAEVRRELFDETPAIGLWNKRPIEDAQRKRIAALEAALRVFVSHEVDYMRRNDLGDPEQQDRVKLAREALPKGQTNE